MTSLLPQSCSMPQTIGGRPSPTFNARQFQNCESYLYVPKVLLCVLHSSQGFASLAARLPTSVLNRSFKFGSLMIILSRRCAPGADSEASTVPHRLFPVLHWLRRSE